MNLVQEYIGDRNTSGALLCIIFMGVALMIWIWLKGRK